MARSRVILKFIYRVTSTRKLIAAINRGKFCMYRILREENLYLCHFNRMQNLVSTDVPFARFITRKTDINPDFLQMRQLSRDAVFSISEIVMYGTPINNPHIIHREKRFQDEFRVNVRFGIIEDHVDPFELPKNLNGE